MMLLLPSAGNARCDVGMINVFCFLFFLQKEKTLPLRYTFFYSLF